MTNCLREKGRSGIAGVALSERFCGSGFSRESTHHDVATINPTTGNHRRLQPTQLGQDSELRNCPGLPGTLRL